MSLQKNLSFVLLGEDKSASSTMNHVGGVAGKLSHTFAALGAVVAGAFTVERIFEFGKVSVEAFAEAEKAQVRLEDAFARFPALADTNIEAFRKLNEQIQAKTGFDHNQLAAAEANLAAFGLTGKQLTALSPLIADFAAKTGQSAPDAATALGKALLGNARALKSIGVDFHNTGNLTGNYNELMQALTTTVGGFAANEGKTFSGQLAILKVSFEDLKEKVGSAFAPALGSLVKLMTDHVIPTFDVLVDKVGPKVQAFLDSGAKGLGQFIDAIAGAAKAGSLKPLEDFFSQATKSVPAFAILQQISGVLGPLMPQIASGISTLGAALSQQGVMDAISKLITDLLPPLVNLLVTLAPAIPPIASFLSTVLVPSIQLVSGNLSFLYGGLSEVFKLLSNKESFDQFVANLLMIPNGAGQAFRGFLNEALGAFNAVDGLINNFLDGMANAINAVLTVTGNTGGKVSFSHLPTNMSVALGGTAPSASHYGHHATGGDIAGDQWSMVGENGPELMRLPGGSHVFTNSQLGGMGGSGGGVVIEQLTVNGFVGNAAELSRVITTTILNAVKSGQVSKADWATIAGVAA